VQRVFKKVGEPLCIHIYIFIVLHVSLRYRGVLEAIEIFVKCVTVVPFQTSSLSVSVSIERTNGINGLTHLLFLYNL